MILIIKGRCIAALIPYTMKLRDYQVNIGEQAAELLRQYKIAYLALEVRTGKTLTAFYAAELYGFKHVLFLTKKKAIGSIEDDYEALGVGYMVTIINYEQLHKFDTEGVDLIICDEAHCLGQFPKPAERTKLLKNIAAGLPIIYLSGTPSPESYSQLYHQLWISTFTPFHQFETFYKWANYFVNKQTKYLYGRQINDYSNANKELIDTYCKHLFISFTQKEAGFENEVQEEVLTVAMKPSTYNLIERLRRDLVYITKDGKEILADTAVKLMNKLHQLYSGTIIFEDGDASAFDHSKAEFIRDRFAGKKIAIFYKFKAERDMLIWVFAGKVTSSPEEFRDSNDLVFISQIQSGREGINLSTADALILLNIDFSAVSYLQVRARMQAKDRVKENKIYWVFSKNGIEHRIYERVKSKEDFTVEYFKKGEPNTGRIDKAIRAQRVASD